MIKNGKSRLKSKNWNITFFVYKSDIISGPVTQYFTNGIIIESQAIDGKLQGKSLKKYSNGDVEIRNLRDNKIVGEVSINKYNGERVIILDYKEDPLEQILIKYLIIGEK